jgi:hypothetical protein
MSHETEIKVVSRSQAEEHCQSTDGAMSIYRRNTVNSQTEHCQFSNGAEVPITDREVAIHRESNATYR